jgi:uncharacterized protein (DUF2461 family)
MKVQRFEGFSPGFFRFFSELALNNNKDWFDAHRCEYETEVLGTLKSFVRELGEFVHVLSPELETEPRVGRTISRVANDMRFHRDRPPYRPYMYVCFPRRGRNWSNDAMLYGRVGSQGISIGFYPGGGEPLRLGPVQQAIQNNLRSFQKYLDQRRIAEKYFELTEVHVAGRPGKWPLPATARRWTRLESFTVGEFFEAADPRVRTASFLNEARKVLLDLYPLWLFATSEDINHDLNLYRENEGALDSSLVKARVKRSVGNAARQKRNSDSRRQHHSR